MKTEALGVREYASGPAKKQNGFIKISSVFDKKNLLKSLVGFRIKRLGSPSG